MRIIITILAFSSFMLGVKAQDMDSLLNSMTSEKTTYATATFKATRIINGHSIEQMKAGQLDVRIHHRFGTLNGGSSTLFGLDEATTFLGLDYGITDRLMVGCGRTAYQQTYNGYFKYHLLSQSTGDRNVPVSLVFYSGMDIVAAPYSDPTRENYFSSRLSYVFQGLIARKFSESFSFQLAPTLVHKNLVEKAIDPNDIYSLGFGSRLKLTRRVSLNAEYFYTVRPNVEGEAKLPNSFSIGFDIETGGHVFQLFFTNSMLTYERGFITETTGSWKDGDIRFGFNISRVFSLTSHSQKSW